MTTNDLKTKPQEVLWKKFDGGTKLGECKVIGFYHTPKSIRFEIGTQLGQTSMNAEELSKAFNN